MLRKRCRPAGDFSDAFSGAACCINHEGTRMDTNDFETDVHVIVSEVENRAAREHADGAEGRRLNE